MSRITRLACILLTLFYIQKASAQVHDFDSLVNSNEAFRVSAKNIGDTLDLFNETKPLEVVFEVQVGIDVISGTYYNAVNGYSPSALIPGAESEAPVQVEPVDILKVYLPLVLRNN